MSYLVIGGASYFVGSALSSLYLVRRYSDPIDKHPLATIAATVNLTVALLLCAMLPLDVLSVSAQLPQLFYLVSILYHGYFSLLLWCTFFLGPFVYFYIEEVDEDSVAQISSKGSSSSFDYLSHRSRNSFSHQNSTIEQKRSIAVRSKAACRYTAIFLFALVILLLAGLALRPEIGSLASVKDVQGAQVWVSNLLDFNHDGLRVFMFCVCVLAILGLHNVIVYTCNGLISLPMEMLQRPVDLKEQKFQVEFELKKVQEAKNSLAGDSTFMGARLFRNSTRESREEFLLGRQERMLRRKLDSIREQQNSASWMSSSAFFPLRFLFGLCCLVLSTLIVASLGISTVDRFMHSCGWSCGFSLSVPQFMNPLDICALKLSTVFVGGGELLIGLVGLYLLVCTFAGISEDGVVVLGMQLVEIKRGGSWPQALVVASSLALVTMLTVVFLFSFMFPDFSLFGLVGLEEGGGDDQHISQFGLFTNQIFVSMPLSSLIFLCGSCLILFKVFVQLVRRLYTGSQSDNPFSMYGVSYSESEEVSALL